VSVDGRTLPVAFPAGRPPEREPKVNFCELSLGLVTRMRPVRAARAAATLLLVAIAAMVPLASANATTPTYTLWGHGWGHGIGMGQWGAKGLADKGWSLQKITSLYYHGTAIGSSSLPSDVRVGLIQNQNSLSISGNGAFDLVDHTGARRATAASGQTWTIKPITGTNQLAAYDPTGKISFTSPVPITVYYESHSTLLKVAQTGYQYKHGRIDLDIDGTTGKERAILIVNFEQYLYGLGEMPASWPAAALQTQAIAGRTYAAEKISRLGQNRPGCNCGMYASTLDQAYVGAAQEVTNWVNAVNSTKGQALTYGGKLIQAYYSASDGGYTENNENVWGGSAVPYLRGVCDPGDYDNGADPHANWTVQIDGNQMGSDLASGGYNVGTVTHIDILAPRGVSGRVRPVIDATHGGWKITGTTSTARISGGTFQSLLGLQSTMAVYNITGEIRKKYDALNCTPGLPNGQAYTWKNLNGTVRGSAQDFPNGRLFLNASNSKVFWVWGSIYTRYNSERRNGDDLGLPTGDQYAVSGGYRANFEHGYIVWTTSSNTTKLTRT